MLASYARVVKWSTGFFALSKCPWCPKAKLQLISMAAAEIAQHIPTFADNPDIQNKRNTWIIAKGLTEVIFSLKF